MFIEYHGPSRISLCITKLSQLSPPGPACRMVFLDVGWPLFGSGTPPDHSIMGRSVATQRGWTLGGAGPPIHHSKGTTMSFADGSVRHWRWKDARTIAWSQAWLDYLGGGAASSCPNYSPDPDNRNYHEFYRAIWGRP